jgi:hypothetical protein
MINLHMLWFLSPGDDISFNISFHLILLICSWCRGWTLLLRRGWSFTIITIILSTFILFILKDLLANFIVTCTLKDRRVAWLGLVEGYHASFQDFVSLKVEHTICSRMIRITKENAIGGPCLKLIEPTFLENNGPQPKA